MLNRSPVLAKINRPNFRWNKKDVLFHNFFRKVPLFNRYYYSTSSFFCKAFLIFSAFPRISWRLFYLLCTITSHSPGTVRLLPPAEKEQYFFQYVNHTVGDGFPVPQSMCRKQNIRPGLSENRRRGRPCAGPAVKSNVPHHSRQIRSHYAGGHKARPYVHN